MEPMEWNGCSTFGELSVSIGLSSDMVGVVRWLGGRNTVDGLVTWFTCCTSFGLGWVGYETTDRFFGIQTFFPGCLRSGVWSKRLPGGTGKFLNNDPGRVMDSMDFIGCKSVRNAYKEKRKRQSNV